MLPQRPPQQGQRQQGQPQKRGGGMDQASFREGGMEERIRYLMRTMGVTREQAMQILQKRMGREAPRSQTMQRPNMQAPMR